MDPIGLTASLIAIAGLAKHAIRLGITLSKDAKFVHTDVYDASCRIRLIAATIDTARATLEKYNKQCKPADRSEMIDLLGEGGAYKRLKSESLSIRGKFRQLKYEVEPLLKTGWTLVIALKWRYSWKDKF